MPLSEILLQLFPTLPYKWHRRPGLHLASSYPKLSIHANQVKPAVRIQYDMLLFVLKAQASLRQPRLNTNSFHHLGGGTTGG